MTDNQAIHQGKRQTPSDWDVFAIDDGNWEADFGCSGTTDVIQSAMESCERGTKTDGDAPPSKDRRLETGYKLGPRTGRPGKIKTTLPFSAVLQDPIKQVKELFKRFPLAPSIRQSAGLTHNPAPVNLQKLSTVWGWCPKTKTSSHYERNTDLGIVTRDRSKRIAQECQFHPIKETINSTRWRAIFAKHELSKY